MQVPHHIWAWQTRSSTISGGTVGIIPWMSRDRWGATKNLGKTVGFFFDENKGKRRQWAPNSGTEHCNLYTLWHKTFTFGFHFPKSSFFKSSSHHVFGPFLGWNCTVCRIVDAKYSVTVQKKLVRLTLFGVVAHILRSMFRLQWRVGFALYSDGGRSRPMYR